MDDPIDKETLTRDLDAARGRLAGYVGALRHDLDVGARLKSGVARNPIPWFGGAVVIGLLLSRIPARRRKVVVKGFSFRKDKVENAGKAGMMLAVLKFGLDFAKPALIAWAKQRLFSQQSHGPTQRP